MLKFYVHSKSRWKKTWLPRKKYPNTYDTTNSIGEFPVKIVILPILVQCHISIPLENVRKPQVF